MSSIIKTKANPSFSLGFPIADFRRLRLCFLFMLSGAKYNWWGLPFFVFPIKSRAHTMNSLNDPLINELRRRVIRYLALLPFAYFAFCLFAFCQFAFCLLSPFAYSTKKNKPPSILLSRTNGGGLIFSK